VLALLPSRTCLAPGQSMQGIKGQVACERGIADRADPRRERLRYPASRQKGDSPSSSSESQDANAEARGFSQFRQGIREPLGEVKASQTDLSSRGTVSVKHLQQIATTDASVLFCDYNVGIHPSEIFAKSPIPLATLQLHHYSVDTSQQWHRLSNLLLPVVPLAL
jgi:hypothetical protein